MMRAGSATRCRLVAGLGRMSTTRTVVSTSKPRLRALALGGAGVIGIGSGVVATKCQGENHQNEAPETVLAKEYSLYQKMLAEAVGTGIIVAGGCGAVCAHKFAGGTPFGIAVGFGASVMLGVYLTANISGAHLNPAVTVALYANGNAAEDIVGPYVLAQCAGATVASFINYLSFSSGIAAVESAQGIVRGSAGSAAIFDGAFGMVPNAALCSGVGALVGEAAMTAALVFAICGITDPDSAVPDGAAPVLIGTTVATLIGVGGPVTGCGMNPARDLGPRLVTLVTGWGTQAFSTGWYAYTLGPLAGGAAGAAAYKVFSTKGGIRGLE